MRTRIALVAIIPIALITVSTLTQAATVQSVGEAVEHLPGAKTASGTTAATTVMPPSQSVAFHGLIAHHPVSGRSSLLLDLDPALVDAAFLAGRTDRRTGPPVAKAVAVPVTAPPVTAIPAATPPVATTAAAVDTVTPSQRAAWERVAMCEEGGNWTSDGSRFSGGLGITRANWSAYGGGQFAPEGAMATADQQIMVAERIQSDPPDQYGCHGW